MKNLSSIYDRDVTIGENNHRVTENAKPFVNFIL